MSLHFQRNAALYTSATHCIPGPLSLHDGALEFAHHSLGSQPRPGILRLAFADVADIELTRRRWPHLIRRSLLVRLRDGSAWRIWVAEVDDSHAQVSARLAAWRATHGA